MNSAWVTMCVQGHGPVGEKRCVDQSCATASAPKFPPPLPSIARNGQPCVFLKPLRKDGRFLLQEVKVPRQEFLHAYLQDGRLSLQLVRNRDDHSSFGDDGDMWRRLVVEFTSAARCKAAVPSWMTMTPRGALDSRVTCWPCKYILRGIYHFDLWK